MIFVAWEGGANQPAVQCPRFFDDWGGRRLRFSGLRFDRCRDRDSGDDLSDLDDLDYLDNLDNRR